MFNPSEGWYVQGIGTLHEPSRWALAAQHCDILRSQQRLRGSVAFVLASAQSTSRRSDSGGSVSKGAERLMSLMSPRKETIWVQEEACKSKCCRTSIKHSEAHEQIR
jgi:hypothetical protein